MPALPFLRSSIRAYVVTVQEICLKSFCVDDAAVQLADILTSVAILAEILRRSLGKIFMFTIK